VKSLGEANGITDWGDRTVVARESLPGAQRFKTAVHELAHIRLHEPTSADCPACRGATEVEAESVAYTTSDDWHHVGFQGPTEAVARCLPSERRKTSPAAITATKTARPKLIDGMSSMAIRASTITAPCVTVPNRRK